MLANGVKIANYMTLKQGDYSGVSGQDQCNHKGP